jgi:hypothetical protein
MQTEHTNFDPQLDRPQPGDPDAVSEMLANEVGQVTDGNPLAHEARDVELAAGSATHGMSRSQAYDVEISTVVPGHPEHTRAGQTQGTREVESYRGHVRSLPAIAGHAAVRAVARVVAPFDRNHPANRE